MTTTHYVQMALAAIAAAAGAIAPFLPPADLAYAGAVAAVCLSIAKVLGVQSEVRGDK